MNFLFKPFDSDDYRRVFWALFWLTLVVMLIGVGLRSPWPADEPRFVEAAREMVANGQWLFPSRGGEFYPDKPPVFMWAIALCYLILGNLKLAFLLPNAFCGLLTVMLVYDLGAKLWNVRTGRNAALLLLLVPQFLVQVKSAQIDAMVMCWITVGCYGLIRHFMLGPNWRWYFVSWAFMGLGVITKGVGFLPLLMLLPLGFYAWRQQLYRPSWKWRAALGPLVMLAVIAAWLVPMVLTVLHNGSPEYTAYMNNILFKQTGHRYANAWHHIKPWYFFIVSVIPWLWFPLPFLAVAHWKTFVAKIKADPQIVILLAWVALVVLFFSISPGKRNLYILPALPIASLAVAAALQCVGQRRWFEWLVTGLLWLVSGLTLALGVMAVMEMPWLLNKLDEYTDNLAAFGYFLIVMAVLWLVILGWARRSFSLIRAGAMTFVGWMLFATWGYQLLDSVRTPKAVLQHTAEVIGNDAQLGLLHFKEQFILFSPLDITHFSYLAPLSEQERNAWRWMQQGDKRYLLLPGDDKLQCFDMSKGQNMGTAHRIDWYLLGADALLPTCPEPERVEIYHTERPGKWMAE